MSAIPGSERRSSKTARLIGPADPNEVLDVTVVIRRRPDGPALPDHDYFRTTPPLGRQRMSDREFAAKYGASQEDINKVVAFVGRHGLTVVETSEARRMVIARGTVAQMSAAFTVELAQYEHEVKVGRQRRPQTEKYRGRDGVISVPSSLDGIVVGVFGLDNRRVGQTNGAEPPNTDPLWVPIVSKLYNYPTNSAGGQTIGIFSLTGYATTDISGYFTNLNAKFPGSGYATPTITDILINGATNPGFDPDGETTQDIDIASSFAPGCAINVYITTSDQAGWVQAISRVAHPNIGDIAPSVLSSSWFIADGDDPAGLAASFGSPTIAFLLAVSAAFHDAAIQGVTVCIASGDRGTDSGVGDGKCHVQYPASDPWVLSVGGTTIGNVSGSSFDEYVWNDPNADPFHSNWGTTGGGVSALFPPPSYQSDVGVPLSLNPPHSPGRGVPDVAGNANIVGGYLGIVLGGLTAAWPPSGINPFPGNGTSASAPQWAGLIALINAALGFNVGFVNPLFYALGSSYFHDIVPGAGPADNSNSSSSGYSAGPGWDACTGWGSPRGVLLLNALKHFYGPVIAVNLQDDLQFGTICRGPAYLVIRIYNVGNRDLVILSVQRAAGSADFTVLSAPATPLAIAPGAQVDFTVRFNPTTIGVVEVATIQITSNDPVTPVLDLPTEGRGGAGALETVITDNGAFGECCVGEHRDEPLTLHNNGPCELSVSAVTSSSAGFVLPNANTYPLIIAAGTSTVLPIRFQPTAPGAFSATLTVLSSDPAGPKHVGLSGTAAAGKLAVTGSTIFGPVPACCRVERTIAICNVGDCKLPVASVAFKRKSRHWKLVNNPFPATLHPGSCLNVVIRYIATEKLPRSCDLVITSDDPTNPVKTLEVMATTVWEECCAKCCEDCRKGCCQKQHCDSARCRKCAGERHDEGHDDEDE